MSYSNNSYTGTGLVDNMIPNSMNNSTVQSINSTNQQMQQQTNHVDVSDTGNFNSPNEKDRAIYHKNNLRLQELEKEIREFTTYGTACDELIKWLRDDRAYNPVNEAALLSCVAAIYEVHVEHGRWSGLQILKIANEKCSGLSERGRASIKGYYLQASRVTQPARRPSEGSVTSNSSTNIPNSPSSIRSATNASTPQSPNTANFFANNHNLVKNIFDINKNIAIVSSPSITSSSPIVSPHFSNTDAQQILSPQSAHHYVLPNNILNDQSNSIRNNQNTVNRAQHHQYQGSFYQPQQYQTQPKSQIPPIQQQQLQQQQQQQQLYLQQQQQIQLQQQQEQLQQQIHQQKLQQMRVIQQQQQQQHAYRQQHQRQQQHQQQQQQSYWPVHFSQNHVSPINVPPTNVPPTYWQPNQTNQPNQPQQPQQPQHSPNLIDQVFQLLNSSTNSSNLSEVLDQALKAQQNLPTSISPNGNSNPTASRSTVGQSIIPNTTIINTSNPSTAAVVTPTPTSINIPHIAAEIRQMLDSQSKQQKQQTVNNKQISIQLKSRPQGLQQSMPIHLPKIPQATQIHLPGSSQDVKAKKLLDPVKDCAKFKFSKEYAVKPFRVIHDQAVIKKSFYVTRDTFSMLHVQENQLINEDDTKFPLTYIFTSWYNDQPERKCEWPSQLRVELNGNELALEKRVRHRVNNSNNATFTGKDLPFDLTRLIRLGENNLVIYQIGCVCVSDSSYNFAIQIHKRHSENSLTRLINSTEISIQTSENLIDSLLGNTNEDDDDEIVILQESVKVSLKCPITMKRMKLPTRGKRCRHVDCFDFTAYLLINDIRNPSWACPRCNSPVYPDTLARDLLTESLLKKLPKNVSEIEFKGDHTNYKITKVDDPDTDDESNDFENDEKDDIEKGVKSEDLAVAEIPSNTTVIDLISDDEEEEVVSNSERNKRPRIA